MCLILLLEKCPQRSADSVQGVQTERSHSFVPLDITSFQCPLRKVASSEIKFIITVGSMTGIVFVLIPCSDLVVTAGISVERIDSKLKHGSNAQR